MLDLLLSYGLPFGAGIFAYTAGKWFARQPLLSDIRAMKQQLQLAEKLYGDVRDKKNELTRDNVRLAADLAYWRPERSCYECRYDGFIGQRIGTYVTREGRRGYVLQALDSKVVHVYAVENLIDRPREDSHDDPA